MTIPALKSKIHRATVTAADLDYEGSITIDAELLEAADIQPYEFVHVWNVSNGARIETYVMRGEPGSGVICINGAAAHLFQPGELVIIASTCQLSREELATHRPRLVFVDSANRITRREGPEKPGPAPVAAAGR
jgi:aspartate 1-decarboxylase